MATQPLVRAQRAQRVQLLRTKLYIPPPRPAAQRVPRPRLIERLDAGLGRKLTLISASAGFGKTTLLSEWAAARSREYRAGSRDATRREREQHDADGDPSLAPYSLLPTPRFSWLSLDEGDNDLVRFLVYLVAALQTVEADIGQSALSALESPQPPPAEAILTSLINEIAAVPNRIVLILDDYHLIEAQPIHDALSFLLRHLPPHTGPRGQYQGMHLVLTTREDPPLPLARLRARGQLTELRATDLRFSSSEAAEFLNQVMGLSLPAKDIAALETRTEGWVAGLQLAAISMQGHKDVTPFIQSFTGSHRFVLDYLVEEVLQQQSASVQTFLLQTAILGRLTGPLSDAVTGQDDGQETLEMLERANLFIVSLDEERRWYRYHHLFADLLRQHLHQHDPEQMRMLHRRASEWYEHNKLLNEAIDHALRAEDFERAVHLIEGVAETYWGRAEVTELRSWLAKLPSELVVSRPNLSIFHAWFLRGRGQLDAAERTLQAAERALECNSDRATDAGVLEETRLQSSDQVKFRGRAAAVRAFISSYRGDVPGIIQFGREALVYLLEQDLNWRSMTAIVLGDAHAFRGDMTAAYEARSEALKACKAARDQHFIIVASLKIAITQRAQGLLKRTLEICQQQMRLADEIGLSQTRLAGFLLSVWGETLAELNDLEQGLDLAKRGFELLERKRNMEMLGWSYLCLMRVLYSRGDLVGAEEVTRKLGRIAQETATPAWIPKQMAAWQVRLWLAQDKLEAASQWVEERGFENGREREPPHEIDFFMLNDYVILARILFAQGRLDETSNLLLHLLNAAKVGGRTTKAIEIQILQALAFQAGGKMSRALATVEQAINLAEPEGFIRIFVDEGPPMARLLYEALSREIAPDYVRRLLAAFPVAEPKRAAPLETQAPRPDLIEPLSERELEVLQLLAEGLTNQEIASRLFLALNTVKAHSHNIYGKLGVHSRTQAVAKARTLGLLPST